MTREAQIKKLEKAMKKLDEAIVEVRMQQRILIEDDIDAPPKMKQIRLPEVKREP
jgi:hypothetical protein